METDNEAAIARAHLDQVAEQACHPQAARLQQHRGVRCELTEQRPRSTSSWRNRYVSSVRVARGCGTSRPHRSVIMDDLAATIGCARETVEQHHPVVAGGAPGRQDCIGGRSHVLVPTRVIGGDLARILGELVGTASAAAAMYGVGERIGAVHAASFLDGADGDVPYRLLAGALLQDRAGYGNVDLLLWEPYVDPRFTLLWESETSCCATVAVSDGHRGRSCQLLAGYLAGWAAEATGLVLRASELSCRAEGLARCRFLLAHGDRLEDRLRDPRYYLPSGAYTSVRTTPG